MDLKRIAVIGAGAMARVRAKALLSTGQVALCGIASRSLESAHRLGAEMGSTACYDDYRQLAETAPDAVLIEIPHQAQDDAVLWALEQGFHVLVGGCLASTLETARRIQETASNNALIVEAGYEARYDALWVRAKELVDTGALGGVVAVQSIALWNGNPESWYYQQEASGGMPLTHMTYCFINPLRWILGEPHSVFAAANRARHTAPGLILEETCVATIRFSNDVVYNATASFIRPGNTPGWSALILGTDAALEVLPEPRVLRTYREDGDETLDCSAAPDAFEAQAHTFVAALSGENRCRNTPDACLGDIRTAEAIVTAARDGRVVDW